MTHQTLFSEFSPITQEQWIARCIKDLKGKDFTELNYTTPDGITIKPFYTEEDINQINTTPLFNHTNWNICVEIDGTNEVEGNKQALHALKQGADSLLFYVNDHCNLLQLLQHIQTEILQLHFVVDGNAIKFLSNLRQQVNTKHYNINIDFVEQLLRTGVYRKNLGEDLAEQNEITVQTHTLIINGNIYHNSGATSAYEIGCILAHLNVYLNNQSFDINAIQNVQLNVACGENYFFEIAKLRALRKVMNRLFEVQELNPVHLHIHAETSTRYLTAFDVHNNLLRNTTAAMAAVTGGCNSLSIKPHTQVFAGYDEQAQRFAINIQHLLKAESYFDKVADISAGAFYIENLTETLAQKGWEYFTAIETEGGLLSSLQNQTIQNKIEAFAAIEQQAFDAGELILVGTNKFPNVNETLTQKMIWDEPKPAGTIKPLFPHRLAQKNEIERQQANV